MKFRLMLFFNSILLLNTIRCEEEIKPRVLSRNDYEAYPTVEQQTIREYSSNTTVADATFDDVIEEIIDSSRQGRNIDGLDEVYSDPTVKQALLDGDDTQARNLIRDKLCDLGLMECEKRAPIRYIHSQPPPSAIYSQRPVGRPPPPHVAGGIYGQPRPVPLPGQYPQQHQQQQPPRKVGYAPSNLNNFHASKPIGPIYDKYSTDFYENDQAPSSIKFGYTEKPTIIVNQGKREVPGAPGVSQNHHVHHHYVHVDGNTPVDGTKTIVVNTPISEYSAVNSLSGSYQTSGFGASGSGNAASIGYNPNQNAGGYSSGVNGGFSPSASDYEYKGVNSGVAPGIYGGSGNVKPVFESQGQYASGYNQVQQQQPQLNVGPAVFTDGSNGIYNVGSSYHASAPDAYKKELNLNGNRGNGLSGNYYNQQQLNTQNKYSKNQYNQGEQYQGLESARQDQFDCVCVSFDQCPAQDVVGRRDDLILPIDPRHLPTDIEADGDNSTLSRVAKNADATNSTEVTRAKRQVGEVEKVEGEGRLFGFGGGPPVGGPGYYPNHGGHGGKKILPTLGVSFGLPYPTHGYPISPLGHIPNPHFGAISPNGLNLGLLNVNPLFSLQVTKSEHGEKLVKPFVNLHVSPSENIIGKIGSLFAAKKGSLHKHYHRHSHRYPPPPFNYYPHHEPHHVPHHHFEGPPHHFEGPHHFDGPPQHFDGPPPHFEGHQPHFGGPPPHFENHHPHFDGPPHLFGGPQHFDGPPHHFDGGIFSKPPPFYRDVGHHQKGPIYEDIDLNPGILGFRSNNISFNDQSEFPPNNQFFNKGFKFQQALTNSIENLNSIKDDIRYARQYSYSDKNNENSANENNLQSLPAQAPGSAEGSATVSFPNNRRKRDTDQVVPASIEKKENLESVNTDSNENEGRALSAEKRQAFYQQNGLQQQQQPKQCGPRAVCCRKPYRAPHQQQAQFGLQQQQFAGQQQQFGGQQQQFGGQHQTKRCGVRNAQGINGRIKNPVYVDGDSEFGEYPWQAAILKKDPKESVYVCGGTLIDASHIVTAAHCVKTYSGFDLRVRLGEWDVNHDVEFYPYVERDVISVHVHPEYYAGTLDNDLAILKLSQPVDFSGTPHINPACLPDKFTDFSRQRCWTTGWGKDNWEYGKYQNILKEVDVPIIDQNTCQNQLRQTRLGYNYNLNPGFICAGGEEGKDACKGDGGGPLVCERNGVWQVAGIVSWGIGCGKVNVPGVYVRVSHYLDWIAQITQRY